MSLGIYNILSELILEATSRSKVEDAIERKQRIRIYYRGGEGEISGYRNIEPYVLGLSKAGNPILRAWQINGTTATEAPMWKTFRLDKITDWRPFPNFFYSPISDSDSSIPDYRENGDDSMTTIYKQVKF